LLQESTEFTETLSVYKRSGASGDDGFGNLGAKNDAQLAALLADRDSKEESKKTYDKAKLGLIVIIFLIVFFIYLTTQPHKLK
jgi:hypothetical protein